MTSCENETNSLEIPEVSDMLMENPDKCDSEKNDSEDTLEPTKELENTHEDHEDQEQNLGSNVYLEGLTKELELLQDPESKLHKAVEFMEKSLSQNGTPHFKSFWQARDICLQLFKENIAPAVRVNLWSKYSDLSKEARRLKVLLDEQSAFAIEQIEIAIQALENSLQNLSEPVQAPTALLISCKALESNLPYYEKVQFELSLLNTHASRINALRKELIKTEMRVRKKNKFFTRLSLAGDKIFPRRKGLIKEVSDQFIADVDLFISKNFSNSRVNEPLFALREEIKHLQGMAKTLTLNTHAFTQTRMRLSECWDKLKQMDKERKQERVQQKSISKQHVDEVMQKIEAFKQSFEQGQMSIGEAGKQLDEISSFMRTIRFDRDEIRYLRNELNNARQPLEEQIRAQTEKRLDAEREKLQQKQQKITEIKQETEALIGSADSYEVENLISARDALFEKIQSSPLTKQEKQNLERPLKVLRDIISEKKEKSLISLSDDDRQALQQLREVLKQKTARRQEVKDQLETLRKAAGASGLDFERAMEFNAQINEEKDRLDKINHGILEIENKIKSLKGP